MDVSRVSLRRYSIVICIQVVCHRCTGAGFRESDRFASHLHGDVQFQNGVLKVLNRAGSLGFAVPRWLEKPRFGVAGVSFNSVRQECQGKNV